MDCLAIAVSETVGEEDSCLRIRARVQQPPLVRHLAQGDGVDWQSIPKILEKLKKEGIAAETWQQAAAVMASRPLRSFLPRTILALEVVELCCRS